MGTGAMKGARPGVPRVTVQEVKDRIPCRGTMATTDGFAAAAAATGSSGQAPLPFARNRRSQPRTLCGAQPGAPRGRPWARESWDLPFDGAYIACVES